MGFYEFLAEYYDGIFPATEAEMAFITARLAEWGAGSVADVGCGTGLHAHALARLGFDVVGYDLEPEMVGKAQERLEHGIGTGDAPKGRLSFAVADMLRLPLDNGAVDACMCIGNVLAHLPHMGMVTDALREFGRVVGPGGYILLQTVNFDRVVSRGAIDLPEIRIANDGREFVFGRRYMALGDGKAVFVSSLGADGEAGEVMEVPMLCLTAHTMAMYAEQAGLDITALYGNFAGDALTADSPSLIACIQCPMY